MGGGAWAGWGGGGEGGGKKLPRIHGPQLPPDGPEHPTRPKRHHCDQGGFQAGPPNWRAPEVPICQPWSYKVTNSPLTKADQSSLAMGDMLYR